MIDILFWPVVTIAIATAIVVLGAPFLERILLYHPDPTIRDPASCGLTGTTSHSVPTSDGQQLIVWLSLGKPGVPWILYLHGNGGHLGDRADRIAQLQAQGFTVAIMAYRGYSGSSGQPSESKNVADAQTVLAWLNTHQQDPKQIFLYGESLGTGVAVQAAARQHHVAGLILDAPYTAIVDIGAEAYPYLPVRLMMRDRYETHRFVGKTTCPILILHGEQDAVIPIRMGRTLAQQIGDRAEFVAYKGAGHSDLHLHGALAKAGTWMKQRVTAADREIVTR